MLKVALAPTAPGDVNRRRELPMNVDIQLDTPSLQRKIAGIVAQQALASMELGIAGVLDVPFDLAADSTTAPGVVDHVDIAGVELEVDWSGDLITTPIRLPPVRQSFAGPLGGSARAVPRTENVRVGTVLARCVVDVYCVPLDALRESGPDATPESRMKVFQVRINLKVGQPVLAGTTLGVDLDVVSVDFGWNGVFVDPTTLPPAAQAAIARITDRLQAIAADSLPTLSFPLGSVLQQLGVGYVLWNAGVAVSRTALTIRLQFDREDLSEGPWSRTGLRWALDWRSFFNGSATARLGDDDDWGVFLPRMLFETRISRAVTAAFAGRSDVRLQAGAPPRTSWTVVSPDGGSSGSGCQPGAGLLMETRFGLTAMGACVPWGFDIGATVLLELTVSMPRPGTIRLDAAYSYEIDEGDAALCSIANSFLASSALGTLGGTFGGWIGATVGAALGGLLGGIGTLAGVYLYDVGEISAGELEPVPGVENAYYTEISIEPPTSELLGDTTVTGLIPCDDGVLMAGTYPETHSRLALLGSVDVPDRYRWLQSPTGCPPVGTTPALRATAFLVWQRPIRSSRIPVRMWGEPAILESVPSRYTSYLRILPRFSFDRIVLELYHWPYHLQALHEATADGPPPSFELLLQSNAGARIVRVPGPDRSLNEATRAEEAERIVRTCGAREDLMEHFEDRARRLIDLLREPAYPIPAPDGLRWIISAAGLRRGDSLVLGTLDPNGGFKARETLRPDELGTVQLRFSLLDGWDSLALHVQRGERMPKQPGGPQNDGAMLSIAAETLARITSLELRGDYRDHDLAGTAGAPRLAMLTAQELTFHTLESAAAPKLRWAVPADGLQHVKILGDGIAAWGPAGTWYGDSRTPWSRVAGPVERVQRLADALVLGFAGGTDVIRLSTVGARPCDPHVCRERAEPEEQTRAGDGCAELLEDPRLRDALAADLPAPAARTPALAWPARAAGDLTTVAHGNVIHVMERTGVTGASAPGSKRGRMFRGA
jgi:hypothetical protein